MTPTIDISGFHFSNAALCGSHKYLVPVVLRLLAAEAAEAAPKRIFELGCGNGAVAHELQKSGYEVTGVDPSVEGIRLANRAYPELNLHRASTNDNLAGRFGAFPIVLSLEVVEHVYAPRQYARRVYELLDAGGVAIISTPYNGYLKNLLIALLGQMDRHHTALWDHGHIKFWSKKTLRRLLEDAGLKHVHFTHGGRIAPLAKSMIAVARK